MDVLFLAHRAPFPPDRGDRIRSYHVLKHLAARARVHLVAFVDEAAEAEPAPELVGLTATCTLVHRRKGHARALLEALATGRPVSLTAFADAALTAAISRVLTIQQIDAVYAFSGQMAQYLPEGGPGVTMDFVDVDSAKFADLARRARPPLQWLYRREARLLGAFERDIAERVDASLFVSRAEAELFRDGGGQGRIEAIENGIDARFFNPAGWDAPAGSDIVFTGQMDYAPNIEAVTWFARAVLPLVRIGHPAARFLIVGRAPTPAVSTLAAEPGVVVTGAVPDTRPWLAGAAVVAAPVHLARGVQNKVLEAMAMARPVVATIDAARGIDHAGTIRIADGAEAFAAAAAALLADRVAGDALGRAARAEVVARYDWGSRLAALDRLVGLSS